MELCGAANKFFGFKLYRERNKRLAITIYTNQGGNRLNYPRNRST